MSGDNAAHEEKVDIKRTTSEDRHSSDDCDDEKKAPIAPVSPISPISEKSEGGEAMARGASHHKGDEDALVNTRELMGTTSGSGSGDADEDRIAEGRASGTDADAGAGAEEYKLYKMRWFGLVSLTFMNIIVSWDVSRMLSLSPSSPLPPPPPRRSHSGGAFLSAPGGPLGADSAFKLWAASSVCAERNACVRACVHARGGPSQWVGAGVQVVSHSLSSSGGPLCGPPCAAASHGPGFQVPAAALPYTTAGHVGFMRACLHDMMVVSCRQH